MQPVGLQMKRAATRIATAALAIGIWLIPPPEGLTIEAWRLFAIFAAAILVSVEGFTVLPEIMIPVVSTPAELEHQRQQSDLALRVGPGIALGLGDMGPAERPDLQRPERHPVYPAAGAGSIVAA